MDKMTELYDILCDELEKITEKGELTAGSLDAVDKIVDIMKDMEEMGYSGDENMIGRSYRGSYRDGREKITAKGELTAGSLDAVDKIVDIMKDIEEMGYSGDMMGRSYRGSYRDGRSYNRYAQRRDSRGRYSRHDIVEQLEDIADSAPNEKSRKEIERLITKMEQM